jgi:hypothetical protein
MAANVQNVKANRAIFAGAVQESSGKAISLAVLDEHRKSVEIRKFSVSPSTREDALSFRGERNGYPDFGEDFRDIARFVELSCRNVTVFRILFAVPEISPDPNFPKPYAPPCAILDKDAVILKLSFLFAQLGLIAFVRTVLNTDDPDSKIALRPFLAEGDQEYLKQRQPFFVAQNVLTACSGLLLDGPVSAEHVAGVAALLAKWTSAYGYWTSFGRVFSSGDILTFMRSQNSRTYVTSASEDYGIRKRPGKIYENAHEIPIEFALAMQNHKELSENDALKVAVMRVCKFSGITLTCHSKRSDLEKPEYTQVWPVPKEYAWVLDRIGATS